MGIKDKEHKKLKASMIWCWMCMATLSCMEGKTNKEPIKIVNENRIH